MIHSMRDNDIWEDELQLMVDQIHADRVWTSIEARLPAYLTRYFERESVKHYIKQLIDAHSKVQDKYAGLFAPDLMGDYEEDVDGFKGSILSKQCTVIQKTLNSPSDALKEWKIQYKITKAQELYDTFHNLIQFAEDYSDTMTEAGLEDVDSIDDLGLAAMVDEGCYLRGVIGTGIMSTVLNSIYPRVFPGHFKVGVLALLVLSGIQPIDMGSDSSEFIMVKDDVRSKTGTVEAEHNYFYPYETFSLFSLRIFRELEEYAESNLGISLPCDYRYIFVNDFYQFVFDENRTTIQTLLGNDDILKYGYSV